MKTPLTDAVLQKMKPFEGIEELVELCKKLEGMVPKKIKAWENAGAYFAIWMKAKGGRPMFGAQGKEEMMALEEQHGPEAVVEAWEKFAKTQDSKYGWKVFVRDFYRWMPRPKRALSALETLQAGHEDKI